MAGVFREAEIEWNGETYSFVPTMALLRSIEADGTSIVAVQVQVYEGKPQASLMSAIIGKVMRHAGAKVSDDEIYADLMNQSEKARDLYFAVCEAISPTEPANPKKGAAADKPRKNRKAAKTG